MYALQRSIQLDARAAWRSPSFRHVAPPASRVLLWRPPTTKRVTDGVAAMAAATEEQPYGTITEDAPPEAYITLVRLLASALTYPQPIHNRVCRTVSSKTKTASWWTSLCSSPSPPPPSSAWLVAAQRPFSMYGAPPMARWWAWTSRCCRTRCSTAYGVKTLSFASTASRARGCAPMRRTTCCTW